MLLTHNERNIYATTRAKQATNISPTRKKRNKLATQQTLGHAFFFSTIRNSQPLRCSSFRPEKSLKYISLQLLKEKFVTNEKIQLFVLCFSNVLLGP